MAIDSVLHIFIGAVITLVMYLNKVPGIIILSSLICVALGKEVYDHTAVLGHCYPSCLDEHISDFLFSLLFFLLYIPVLALTQKRAPQLSYRHYVVIWLCLASTHLAFNTFLAERRKPVLLANNASCE